MPKHTQEPWHGMYVIKKWVYLAIGWCYSGYGKHCFYGRRAEVLRAGKEIGGLIVIDHMNGPTVILCDDGVIQRGGVFRPVRIASE